MQYNGQEVGLITEGYWPEGETLICSDDGENWSIHQEIVCISNCTSFYRHGDCGCKWQYWALLPAKPAQRRLTNREIYGLWRKGWDICDNYGTVITPKYSLAVEGCPCTSLITLRAPNSDEWVEPTSDLLEVGK